MRWHLMQLVHMFYCSAVMQPDRSSTTLGSGMAKFGPKSQTPARHPSRFGTGL